MTRRRSEQRNMGHDYVLERLSPYIDDRLSGEERTRIVAHLRTCQSCREELRTLQWTRGLLHQVPAVPLPRSFVIREADLAPQRAARWRRIAGARPLAGGRPLAGLQWAAAMVAILLVVVVAGDMFLGGRSVLPESQPQIARLREQAPDTAVTVVVEGETVVETLEVQAATEEKAEAAAPAEAPRMLVAPTPTAASEKVGETARPAEVMGGGGPITETATALPMMVEGGPVTETATALPMMVESAPAKASPGALPEGGVLPGEAPPPQGLLAVPSQGDQPAQETLIAPPPDEQALQQTEATPLAMVPPAEPQEEEPLAASATEEPSERGARLMPALLARVGWRVAEVGLGLLLVGLIVAIAWGRRTR